MWIVKINNNSVGEHIDVIAMSLEELQGITAYIIESKGILELEHVEERWMVFGLQGLKDMTEDEKQVN